ncbi:hypothetical protein BBP40_012527 [Aspergillus hancockii]|nr:hypothetical protein BBP40_012527 [Aspergillus hancockii]
MTSGIASRPLLTLLLSFVSLVIAGHAAWENGATTITTEWVYIDPNEQFRPWPDQTITYCYNSESARERIAPLLRQAIALWAAAGLPESFKYVERETDWCFRNPKDGLAFYGDGDTETYFSSIAMSVPDERFAGPYLYFNPPKDLLPENTLAALTHELGHSWGLLHEHQDPLLWRTNDPGNGEHRGLITFFCENVEGYDQLSQKYGGDKEKLFAPDGPCTSSERALQDGFVAANILPLGPGWRHQSPRSQWPEDENVDWKSIMFYASDLYGKVNSNDEPLDTHVQTKGLRYIPGTLVPTLEDVTGLLHMYRTRFSQLRQDLHNEPRSPWYPLFKQKVKDCMW